MLVLSVASAAFHSLAPSAKSPALLLRFPWAAQARRCASRDPRERNGQVGSLRLSSGRYLNEAALDPSPETSWGKLLALVPTGSRALDVGCGHGAFSAALRRLRGCHVTGVELDEQFAAD